MFNSCVIKLILKYDFNNQFGMEHKFIHYCKNIIKSLHTDLTTLNKENSKGKLSFNKYVRWLNATAVN